MCLGLAWERANLPTCFGGFGQLGFSAQSTYWSAIDLHTAVMPNVCGALNRPHSEKHPVESLAFTVPGRLLSSLLESLLTTTTPWCVQFECWNSRRCRLQNYTVRCLLSNRSSCSVRAGRALARSGLSCTSLRRRSCRVATALRLGWTPDAGPRATCALRKGNDGDMCEFSLAKHPHHAFCCKFWGARAREHRAVLCAAWAALPSGIVG